MVLRMKTTVDIPDELLIRAKKRAAELRKPLKTLIINGLRNELDKKDHTKQVNPCNESSLRWVTVDGALNQELILNDRSRMHDWLKSHP